MFGLGCDDMLLATPAPARCVDINFFIDFIAFHSNELWHVCHAPLSDVRKPKSGHVHGIPIGDNSTIYRIRFFHNAHHKSLLEAGCDKARKARGKLGDARKPFQGRKLSTSTMCYKFTFTRVQKATVQRIYGPAARRRDSSHKLGLRRRRRRAPSQPVAALGRVTVRGACGPAASPRRCTIASVAALKPLCLVSDHDSRHSSCPPGWARRLRSRDRNQK